MIMEDNSESAKDKDSEVILRKPTANNHSNVAKVIHVEPISDELIPFQ